MAKRVETVVVDDLDGVSLAAEAVSFALDGTSYEIDLTAEHAAQMRAELNAYVGVARRVARQRRRTGS